MSLHHPTVQEYAASFLAGVELSHDQMAIDGSGRLTDATDLLNDGRRVALERARQLHQKFSGAVLRAKDVEGKRRCTQLLSLCSFTQAVLADSRIASQIDQPIKAFIDVQPPADPLLFPAAVCTAYLQTCLNSISIFLQVFRSSKVESALLRMLRAITVIQTDMTKHGSAKPHPADLLHWTNTLQTAVRNLELELRPIFANERLRPKKNWLFAGDTNRDCVAVCVTLCQPLLAVERQLNTYLTNAEVMPLEMRMRILPDSDGLVRNLTYLFERRISISGYVDEIRRRCRASPIDILRGTEQKGRSLQETLEKFATDSSRMELSKLITRLKPTRRIESARTGDILASVSCLKRALSDYMDELIEDSLGDAEEALSAAMSILSACTNSSTSEFDPMVTEILRGMQVCIKDTGGFLEAVTWLKDYISKQRGIWAEEIYTKPVAKKPKAASSEPRRTKKKKNAAAVAPKKREVAEPPPPEVSCAVVVKQFSPEEPELTISSVTPAQAAGPRPVNTWKVHAMQMRSMYDLARRVRRISAVNTESERQAIREVLQGALRRRTPEQIAWLSGQKISVIVDELQEDGWSEDHIKGDHHIFKHCVLGGLIVIPYTSPSEQLKPGTFNSITKMAGWK